MKLFIMLVGLGMLPMLTREAQAPPDGDHHRVVIQQQDAFASSTAVDVAPDQNLSASSCEFDLACLSMDMARPVATETFSALDVPILWEYSIVTSKTDYAKLQYLREETYRAPVTYTVHRVSTTVLRC